MKVFLVFLGLLLINVTCISYKGDLDRYLQLRSYLKAVAEECAAGAALYYDEEAYSQGFMVIDKEEAERYVVGRLKQAEYFLQLQTTDQLSYEMEIADQRDGKSESAMVSPWVDIVLTLEGRDHFRLPFLSVTTLRRGAKYELADFQGQCYNET